MMREHRSGDADERNLHPEPAGWRSIMTGSAEVRFEALETRIAQLEARRAELLTLIESEGRSDEGTPDAEQKLRDIEDKLAVLRTRIGTFKSDPRHSWPPPK